jgi:hypothetical protein|nr:MAG TPA: Ogr/Delta-like zinc finger protein [Caudoviricetes sp.]
MDNKSTEQKITCNKCGNELGGYQIRVFDGVQSSSHMVRSFVCISNECANYALLQVPSEAMPKKQEEA